MSKGSKVSYGIVSDTERSQPRSRVSAWAGVIEAAIQGKTVEATVTSASQIVALRVAWKRAAPSGKRLHTSLRSVEDAGRRYIIWASDSSEQ